MSDKTDSELNNVSAERELDNTELNRTDSIEDLMTPFTEIINKMVHREITNVMNGMNRDSKLLPKSKVEKLNCYYVKREEFQKAIDKLMPRSIIQTVFERNQKTFIHSFSLLENRLQTIEARLKAFEDRIKKQDIEKRDNLIKDIVQTTIEELGLARPSAAIVSSKVISRISTDPKGVIALLEPKKGLYRCSSSLENLSVANSTESLEEASFKLSEVKQQDYDRQVRLYDRRITIVTSSGDVKQTLMSLSASKLVDEAFDSYRDSFHLPIVSSDFEPVLQNEICTRMREQYQRLLAERQLYKTNLLTYKKSSFTLSLNNQKGHFLNALLDSDDIKAKKAAQDISCVVVNSGRSDQFQNNRRHSNKSSKDNTEAKKSA